MPEATVSTTIYCPRCDREYKNKSGEIYRLVLERLKKHVAEQHPDHDPEWYDTFPEHED